MGKITVDLERELGVLAEDLLNGPVVDVIARLQNVLARVPEEYRNAAKLDVSLSSDEYSSIELFYTRPETAEEASRRELSAARRQREREQAERQQLAELKAKYESPNG
jgi:hypothetical protein